MPRTHNSLQAGSNTFGSEISQEFTELRNMVYSYVIDDFIVPLDKPRPNSSASTSVPWDALGRQSLGLTQTCVQIRQEMLPLYRHHVQPMLTESQLFPYISATFPKGPSTAFGDFLVCFPFLASFKDRVDLKPLMQLVMSARDLKLQFRVSPIPPQHYEEDNQKLYWRNNLLDTSSMYRRTRRA